MAQSFTEHVENAIFSPLRRVYKYKYKIVIHERKLNRLIEQKIALGRVRKLRKLRIRIFRRRIFVVGQAELNKRYFKNMLPVHRVKFAMKLSFHHIRRNRVHVAFHVDRFYIRQFEKKIDWLKITSRYTDKIRIEAVDAFCEDNTLFYRDRHRRYLYLNVNYFLKDIPFIQRKFMLLDNTFFVEGVYSQKKELVILGKSNFLLMATLDFFTTQWADIYMLKDSYNSLVFKFLSPFMNPDEPENR